MAKSAKLILLRHGQSEWNRLNLFTGWVDIPLSRQGVEESLEAGRAISALPIDVIFVSSLIRAQMTATLAMSVHKSGKVPYLLHPGEGRQEEWAQIYSSETEKQCVPMIAAWQLNERYYGQLQGVNKKEMMDKHGQHQVKLWRRSFDICPPGGESLAMTAARALPYFKEKIIPYLDKGQNVFISAHGNSLRAIVMHLDQLTKEQVVELEMATGAPLIYEFREGKAIKVESRSC